MEVDRAAEAAAETARAALMAAKMAQESAMALGLSDMNEFDRREAEKVNHAFYSSELWLVPVIFDKKSIGIK